MEHTAVSVHVDNSVMEIQVYIFPAHKLLNTTASVTKSKNQCDRLGQHRWCNTVVFPQDLFVLAQES